MKIGDVVKLKSGGPKMTVIKVLVADEDDDRPRAEVTWFENHGPQALSQTAEMPQAWDGPHEGTFPVEALEIIT
jgi:uncharacterized protein YodC (DUF2158 family)